MYCTRLLIALSLCLTMLAVGACSSIQPLSVTQSNESGRLLFEESTQAHGRVAFEAITDLSVAFDSHWAPFIARIQPELVDEKFRGGSEERMLMPHKLISQTHAGAGGKKFVVRQWARSTTDETASISVRRNDIPDADPVARQAAAIVADAYRLFLLGPLYFIGLDNVLENFGPVRLNGRATDRLRIRTTPGLGIAGHDDYVLFIDREDRLTRRIWFSLNGLESTLGAVVEVNLSEYREVSGVQWPTRFYERIRRPIPFLPAHRWSLLGLDVNRAMTRDELTGTGFSGSAQRPATRLNLLNPTATNQTN